MYSLIWRSIALLLGLCAIVHALAIPAALHVAGKGDCHPLATYSDNVRTTIHEAGSCDSIYAGIEIRGPKGATPGSTPPNQKPPTKPKTPTDPKPGTTPKKTPAVTPAAPLQFEYLVPENKAVDICNTDLECTSEDEPENGPGSPRSKPSKPPKPGNSARSESIVARAPPTTFKGKPGEARKYKVSFTPTPLELSSKPYWTGPDLYNQATTKLQNLKTVYATFKSSSLKAVDMYKVQATSTKPQGKYLYVTEHILELQTIKKFIESVTQTEDEENPKLIKLRNAVDDKWFTDHWNKKYLAVQTRPNPVTYTRPSNDKDETINDIVFEALGSKTNADDFVLCERSINSAKGKLWSNQQPFDDKLVAKKFVLAASGYTDNAEAMTALRTVLAVYEYMKLPEVKSRLENEIKNVKTELSTEKIKHIVGVANLPKDKARKDTIDLAQMWDEYIQRHILRFERKGVDWLKDQVQAALKHYQAELLELEKAEKTLAREFSPAAKEKRAKEMKDLERGGRILKRDVSKARLDMLDEEVKFFRLKEQVDKLPTTALRDAERVKLGFRAQVLAKTAKHRVYFDLRVEYGKKERKAASLDDKRLPKLIKEFREDVEQLRTIEKLVKKMDGDVAADEVALNLGNISIGT